MAEDKRANPFNYPTAEEAIAAPGTREEKAARFVVTRKMGGIPCRAFLMGDNDHSAVMQGVRDLTTAAYTLFEAIDWNAQSEQAREAGLAMFAMLEQPVIHQPKTPAES